MRYRLATTLLLAAALVVATLVSVTTTTRPALAANGPAWPIDTWGTARPGDNVIIKWDEQLLNTIRRHPKLTGPTVAARAIGILHTATFDAWAAYDRDAVGTRLLGTLRQPEDQHTPANKEKAISYAAYRVLTDLFPDAANRSFYDAQMSALGYTDLNDTSPPAVVGNTAAQAVIDFRHGDGSNQDGGYADTTNYQPVNSWETVNDPWRWQPLCVPLVPYGTPCPSPTQVQTALTPQWGTITPFALNPANHMPYQLGQLPGPPKLADGSYDPSDIDTALRDTSNLTDAQKARAEYWADGPQSEFPPGHMASFAQALSRMRQNTLDQDVKLFFALGNALMDASISAWACKFDPRDNFVRPITAIRERYKGKKVTSWLGPGRGFGQVSGEQWIPYQSPNVVTPPFPEYVSGHSTFSAAGRTVMGIFFGTDNFNAKVTIKAGSSKFEAGTPSKDVVLSWKTLTASADDAGMSRRYGGIHFRTGDEHGRGLGKVVGNDAWNKAQSYINGSATEPT